MQIWNPDDWNIIAITASHNALSSQMPFSLNNLKNDFLVAQWNVM